MMTPRQRFMLAYSFEIDCGATKVEFDTATYGRIGIKRIMEIDDPILWEDLAEAMEDIAYEQWSPLELSSEWAKNYKRILHVSSFV